MITVKRDARRKDDRFTDGTVGKQFDDITLLCLCHCIGKRGKKLISNFD
ncbi:hypothetical protein [Butyricicoccus pullicaecorum]|nr:hypothetical protein [Butyricicoccus pullicaecorum]